MQGRNLRRILAGNVRKLRKARGWTQEELAHRCKLHKNFVGMVERSEVAASVDTLEAIAKALGQSAANLLHTNH